MANNNQVKFYGDPAKRVIVILPKDCGDNYKDSDLNFIVQKFNALRNFKNFLGNSPVFLKKTTSDKLPRISSFAEGDVCLLIGNGRFIDKATFGFAEKCFEANIPVYFIRSTSLESDPRVKRSSIWQCNLLTIKSGKFIKHRVPPERYFMEIPSIEDFVVEKYSNQLYALFPAMSA